MSDAPTEASGARARPRRWRRALLALLVSVAVTLVGAELGFRWLLFGEGELAAKWGRTLRRPGFYADPDADGDYWKLWRRWQEPSQRERFTGRDPLLGWLTPSIEPGTRDHRARAWLRGRRPLLMYGDSFTACCVPAQDCWQSLMQRAETGREWGIVNYGVHAYGIDQIYLLMQASIERWVELDPVVAIGILVDNDLDRAVLDFRGCPKPVLRVEGGELAVEPAGTQDIDAWIVEHPPSAPSFLWRYLTRLKSPLPDFLLYPRGDHPELVRRKVEIARPILAAIHEELARRGIEHFFVLFHGPEAAAARAPWTWREELLLEVCAELGIPYVSSRAAMQADHAATGRKAADYFIPKPPFKDHYTAAGNEAVFPALLRALRGEFDGPPAR